MYHEKLLSYTETLNRRAPVSRKYQRGLLSDFTELAGRKRSQKITRILRLFTDYSSRMERTSGEVELRALSVGERVAAFMRPYDGVFTIRFRRQVADILDQSAAPNRIMHTPFCLGRIPELHQDLSDYYGLERFRQEWGIRGWEPWHMSSHHLMPRSLGGWNHPQNLLPLHREFHSVVHYLVDNLPPHLYPLMILACTGHDSRRFDKNKSLQRDLFDLYRDIGKNTTDIGEVYSPDAFADQSISNKPASQDVCDQKNLERDLPLEDRLSILRSSLRVGGNW